jgi:glycosyltransferase involved in cell wall biosynthesis
MKSEFEMLVSIVIPTRNEENDIEVTLERCIAITYPKKEIIVVDDSTDQTPRIVERYADRGVRLIHRETNRNGCCGARNLGMEVARGEIVVLLNADALPTSDFLLKIIPHYLDGADCVVVKSHSANNDTIWSDYLQRNRQCGNETDLDPNWSEGYSCRRSAAAQVGYIPGDFPVPFCRDHMLSRKLVAAGFKKHIDLNIEVPHKAPQTFKEFWNNWNWRGTFSAPTYFYFHQSSVGVIFLREVAKAFRFLALSILLIPRFLRVYSYSNVSPASWKRIPALFLADFTMDLAIMFGNFKGMWRVLKTEFFSYRVAGENPGMKRPN